MGLMMKLLPSVIFVYLPPSVKETHKKVSVRLQPWKLIPGNKNTQQTLKGQPNKNIFPTPGTANEEQTYMKTYYTTAEDTAGLESSFVDWRAIRGPLQMAF